MNDPGSALRDLLYAKADEMDLSPAIPPRVRTKVSRLRRLDALVLGVALVAVVAAAATLIDTTQDVSLPPAERDAGAREAPFEVPLEAGVTYHTQALGGLRFTVDPSFAGTHVHIQAPRLLGIHTSSHDGIALRQVRKVHDPATAEKVAAPQDLVAWLLAHPKITARQAGTIEVDGVTARIVTVTDAEVARFGTPCTVGLLEPLPCLPLIASVGLGGYARADDLIRIYVFERDGMTYSAEGYGTKQRPELAERWDALMRSISFD